MSDSLAQIRNFYRISDQLVTAGQPSASEFRLLREAGFELVVNLATSDSPHALADEAGILDGLGLEYVHLPVDFKNPTMARLEDFCQVMATNRQRRCFVHCALNWRVSSFVFLYRVRHEMFDIKQAHRDLLAVWQPDAVWQTFIDTALQQPVALK